MSHGEVYETRRSARARTPPLVPVACWTRREQSISSSDRVSRADTPWWAWVRVSRWRVGVSAGVTIVACIVHRTVRGGTRSGRTPIRS